MKRKSILALCLLLNMLLGIVISPISIFAQTNDINTEMVVNEYEIYKSLMDKTDEELKSDGYSDKEIEELKSVDLSYELHERAQLDNEILKNMGYTEEQIAILKDVYMPKTYSVLPSTLEYANVQGLFASFTGRTYIIHACDKCITVGFGWEWSSLPVWYGGTDVVAIAWDSTSLSGSPLNTALDKGSSTYHMLNSVNVQTGAVSTSKIGFEEVTPYKTAKSEFVLGFRIEDYIEWMKSGHGSIKFATTGTSSLKEINLRVAYGHTTIGFSPSLSFPGGVSISFGINTSEMYGKTARYTSQGSII